MIILNISGNPAVYHWKPVLTPLTLLGTVARLKAQGFVFQTTLCLQARCNLFHYNLSVMKNLFFLLAVVLFSCACHKAPDLNFMINGQVLDIETRRPIQGLNLYAQRVYIPCLVCSVEYTKYTNTTTDANGNFELNFRVDSESDKNLIKLKLQAMPPGYQDAIVNGIMIPHFDDHTYEFIGATVEDGGFYLIELTHR